MRSPFPGMDPYLEAPPVWPGVHGRLITHMGDLLSEALDRPYFVDVEKRLYVIDEDDPAQRLIRPDAVVAAREPSPDRVHPPAPGMAAGSPAATAILLMVDDAIEVTESRLLVQDVDAGEVIAVIEVLSPTNKLAGSRGRSAYLEKRREVMRSPAHLIEIDLLRGGLRFPSVEPLPPGDGYAHVSRAAMRPRGEVFAWRLADPLPAVPIPLRKGDADAHLDLGEALRRTYRQARYDRRLDYAADPPPPPLSPEHAAFVEAVLREAGAR